MNQFYKDFKKGFEKLAFKHGYFQVFENFLDCAINSFSFNYSPDTMESIRKRYNEEERQIFGQLIFDWIKCCNEEIQTDNSWFDFFGHFYEENAISKQKGFAQYFTPPTICDFMVKILDPTEKESIAEPACGSGRFNLAVHAQNPKLFHHANDLDFTCVKMSALNFMIHGIKGVITCEDTLNIPGATFRSAFIVNDTTAPYLHYTENYSFTNNYIRSKIKPHSKTLQQIEEIKKILDSKPLQDEIIEKLTGEIPPNEILNELGQFSLF